jgi:hypothetical protein
MKPAFAQAEKKVVSLQRPELFAGAAVECLIGI